MSILNNTLAVAYVLFLGKNNKQKKRMINEKTKIKIPMGHNKMERAVFNNNTSLVWDVLQ